MVLALDIAWDRRARDRIAAKETLLARLSTG
jgi:hypothetical protein